MKKSTKLYLQGLIEFIGIPLAYFGLLMLVSKFIAPIGENSFALAFSGVLSVVAIISFFKGFFTLFMAKEVYDLEKNPEYNEKTSEYTESYVESMLQESIEQNIGFGREEGNLQLIKETVKRAHESL